MSHSGLARSHLLQCLLTQEQAAATTGRVSRARVEQWLSPLFSFSQMDTWSHCEVQAQTFSPTLLCWVRGSSLQRSRDTAAFQALFWQAACSLWRGFCVSLAAVCCLFKTFWLNFLKHTFKNAGVETCVPDLFSSAVI